MGTIAEVAKKIDYFSYGDKILTKGLPIGLKLHFTISVNGKREGS